MDMLSPLEFSLGFVAIEVIVWRCTKLLPEGSSVFVRAEAIVGEVSPTHARRPEVSLDICSPLELSLGFVAIEVSLWHCTKLLSEVSPVFVSAEEAIVGEVSPTYASRPEVSGHAFPP